MKGLVIMRLFLILISSVVFFSTSIAYELSDFRIPTHTVKQLTFDMSASGYGYRGVDDRSRYNDASSSFNGYLRGYWLYDSEQLGLEGAATFSARGNRYGYGNRGRDDDAQFSGDQIYRSGSLNYGVNMAGNYLPIRRPLALLWDGSLNASSQASWDHGDHVREDAIGYSFNAAESNRSAIYYTAQGEGGIGWGRMRDATGLYRAYVIAERLREMGRIEGELSAETLRKLGELMYRKDEFRRRHERSDRFFWQEVEKVLKEDPAMKGDLDAFALYRIGESVAPHLLARWSGIRFSMLLYGYHANRIDRSTNKYRYVTTPTDSATVDSLDYYSSSRISHEESILFGPRLEVNIPLTWNIQLNGDSRFEKPLHPADDGFYWTTLLGGAYALHDRWIAYYTFQHERYIHDPKDRNLNNGQSWAISHEIGLYYFVEQHLNFDIRLGQSQDYAWNFVPNSNAPHYDRHIVDYTFGVGFTYLISGAPLWSASRSHLPRTSRRVTYPYYPRHNYTLGPPYGDNY